MILFRIGNISYYLLFHLFVRYLQERSSLEKDPLEFCTVELVNDADIHNWRVKMTGPASTPYAGGIFTLALEFPTQYPFKPPKIKFLTKTYHPSVQTESGDICADVVSEGWGPTLNVRHCLKVIYSMLQNPDGDHPLEEAISKQMRESPKDFEKKAKQFTKDYAK